MSTWVLLGTQGDALIIQVLLPVQRMACSMHRVEHANTLPNTEKSTFPSSQHLSEKKPCLPLLEDEIPF